MIDKNKVLTLCLTESCNLHCVYCYEHNKSAKNMSVDVAKRILDNELNSDDGFDFAQIEYFGGEPFIAFDEMRVFGPRVNRHRMPEISDQFQPE